MEGDVYLEPAPGVLAPAVLAGLTRFGAVTRVSERVWEYAWLPLPSSVKAGAAPWQFESHQSMVYLEAPRLFRWSVDALDLEVGSLCANLSNALRIAGICEYLSGTATIARFVCFPAPGCGADFEPGALGRAFAYGGSALPSDGETLVIGRTTFNAAAFGALLFGGSPEGGPELLAQLSRLLAAAQRERENNVAMAVARAVSCASPEEEINARLTRAIEALRSRSRGSI